MEMLHILLDGKAKLWSISRYSKPMDLLWISRIVPLASISVCYTEPEIAMVAWRYQLIRQKRLVAIKFTDHRDMEELGG